MKPSGKRPAKRRPFDSSGQPPRQHRGHSQRPEGSRNTPPEDHALRIWGTHAVAAALANPKRFIRCVRLTENAGARLTEALVSRRVEIIQVAPRDLDNLVGADAVHQGAVADVEPLPELELEDLAEKAVTSGAPIIVLDQVTDPHNVGAILRSAAVFGAVGVVMTRRHSPPLGGALAKTASGALEIVPVSLVPNLARALTELAEAGVGLVGLDGEGTHEIGDEPFTPPTAIVLGAEGKGLRRLTRELCDRLCRIGAAGSLASLNVSNAAAVALYAASLKR